jgi:nitrate reductase gamma subunit
MAVEFWNIPDGLIKAFYAFAGLTVIIFILGFWDKVRIWSKGMDADQELKGMGPAGLIWLSISKFFSSDCMIAKRVFPRSVIRGLMLMGIMWGFTILFLGTAGRTLNYYIVQFLEGGIWLLFSLILDLAGFLLLVGVGFGLYRKYIGKPERMVKSAQDGILLGLLFLVVISGFLIEGIRIAVLNPPAADWSPVGFVCGAMIKALVGTEALKSLYVGVWTIHFLFAFSFIAYIPFSKYEHIFAAQISNYLFEEKWRKKEIPRDWVFQEEIAQRRQARQNAAHQQSENNTT